MLETWKLTDHYREAELDQSRELQKQLRERERERERCYDPLQVACNSLSIDYNCHKLFVNSLSRYSKACFFFFFWALCCWKITKQHYLAQHRPMAGNFSGHGEGYVNSVSLSYQHIRHSLCWFLFLSSFLREWLHVSMASNNRFWI